MRNPSVYEPKTLRNRNYVHSNETELMRPHVQRSDEQIVS